MKPSIQARNTQSDPVRLKLDVRLILAKLDEIDAVLDLGDIEEGRALISTMGEGLRSQIAGAKALKQANREQDAKRKRPKFNQSSNRQTSSLDRFAEAIGFENYTAYIHSDHWRDVKARYREAWPNCACVGCDEKRYQLHHLTYVRLGHEALADLVPFCLGCHKRVHRNTNLKIPRENIERILREILGLSDAQATKRLEPYYALRG